MSAPSRPATLAALAVLHDVRADVWGVGLGLVEAEVASV